MTRGLKLALTGGAIGGGGGEGPRRAAPGHIRGFDVQTGERRWIFHTVPRPGQYGYSTWPKDAWQRLGGTNSWAGMSLDAERGWLFASTGSPSFDYWGGDRIGQNLFGNSVLALDAETGVRHWRYQVVHHDIWDYDLPAQPALITVQRNGRPVDAVAQVTKQSFVFLLDRETGQPLFPVEERAIGHSNIPGEQLWPTQPFPLKPPPLSRINFTRDQVTDIDPESHKKYLEMWDNTDAGMIYIPTTFRGTLCIRVFAAARFGAAVASIRSGICCLSPRMKIPTGLCSRMRTRTSRSSSS